MRRDPAGALVAEGVGEGHHARDISPVIYREGVVAVGLASGELRHQVTVHSYRERGPVELLHQVGFHFLPGRKVIGHPAARTVVLVFHVEVPAVPSRERHIVLQGYIVVKAVVVHGSPLYPAEYIRVVQSRFCRQVPAALEQALGYDQ